MAAAAAASAAVEIVTRPNKVHLHPLPLDPDLPIAFEAARETMRETEMGKRSALSILKILATETEHVKKPAMSLLKSCCCASRRL